MPQPTPDPLPSSPHILSKSPSATSPSRPGSDARGNSFPFSIRRSIQPNPSSTSIAPSTAEGKPIPVDDSTVEYRTTALRELNHHYPSRHRYAKSTGAQSSTYSEPVIVRSYYAPLPPNRPVTSSRASVAHGGAVSVAGSQSRRPPNSSSRALPFTSKVVSAGSGMLSTMVLARGKRPVNGRAEDEPRLPPVEAFSFKGFMANLETQAGGISGDINADLDRIAEICARSRYSLSNQYEVHYAPHGSGNSFLTTTPQPNDAHGPTLQAVTSDDERSVSTTNKRRRMARRNSRAMGTLETIMSSSRSSDDEKFGKKKTAAELAEEVRGRAAKRESGLSSPSHSSQGTPEPHPSRQEESPPTPPVTRKKSASSLALIDAARHNPSVEVSAPRVSATSLVSEPALPQASTSQLEIRTVPGEPLEENHCSSVIKGGPSQPKHSGLSVAKGAITPMGTDTAGSGILSLINGWIPWRSPTPTSPTTGRAEGSLRELLKSTDIKGKGLERMP